MKRGCIAIGETICSECGQSMLYGERYLILGNDDGSRSRLCIRCCAVKGLVGYRREGGRRLLTFLEWTEAYEPHTPLPPPKVGQCHPPEAPDDFQSELPYAAETGDQHIRQERYDVLLYWCSARGTGRLEHLHEACYTLGLASPEHWAWPVLRTLGLLGHTESVWNGNECLWGIAPATVVQMCMDDGCHFLAGQRIPALLTKLSSDWHISDQLSNGGPTRKIIVADFNGGDVELSGGYRLLSVGCVSMRLAELLPDLLGWKTELRDDPGVEIHSHGFARYVDEAFQAVPVGHLVPGLYQVTKIDGRNARGVYRFYDSGGRWLRGEFYGLRYLDAQLKGKCRASWSSSGDLDIIEGQRWPFLYERALVLASGQLPLKMKNRLGEVSLRYHGVSEALARLLCEKLDVRMVRTNDA